MWWKFTKRKAASRPDAKWRMQPHAEGVSLSLWVGNTPSPRSDWLDLHPATRLLDQWPHEETTASAVRMRHEDVAAMQDYDATRLGLPRYVPADIYVTVNGRPEAGRKLQMDIAVMPYTHHRPWAQARIEHGFLDYDGETYRLRPQQYEAVNACTVLANADSSPIEKLEAYAVLVKLRRQSAGRMGVQVQGYMPAMHIETMQDFTLFTDSRGAYLVPGVHQAEPVIPEKGQLTTRWSDAWFDMANPLPEVALMAGHHYVVVAPKWRDALQAVRTTIAQQLDAGAARSAMAPLLSAELLRRVH